MGTDPGGPEREPNFARLHQAEGRFRFISVSKMNAMHFPEQNFGQTYLPAEHRKFRGQINAQRVNAYLIERIREDGHLVMES
jgi:hypothetical protein